MNTECHSAARRGSRLHTSIRRLSAIRWPVPSLIFTIPKTFAHSARCVRSDPPQ